MPFNDIFRLRLNCRLHGAAVINVMHFVQDDPIPTRGALELAQDFGTNMLASARARCSNQVTFETVEVQSIVPFSGGPQIYTFPGSTVGSQSTGVVSATLCEVVTVYSERGGRRGRGRIYLSGAQTAGVGLSAQGGWSAAQSALTQAYATALFNRYIAGTKPIGWALGVWSRVLGPEFPPWTTSQFARATALTVRSTMRTQRRRQVGVGR